MIKKPDKNSIRVLRHKKIRKKIFGTPECPRLNVYKSTSNIYAQLIDDVNGNTLISSNTLQADVKKMVLGKNKVEQAVIVGKVLGNKAIEAGYKKIVFDRGGYFYTGRISAVANGAREAGLDF